MELKRQKTEMGSSDCLFRLIQNELPIRRTAHFPAMCQCVGLTPSCEEILSMLATMANHPEKWCL